jgi:hypothetical protein
MNRFPNHWLLFALLAVAGASAGILATGTLFAQPAAQPAPAAQESAADVMRKMDSMIKPVNESRKTATQPSTTQPARKAAPVIVNPDAKLIKGVAPDIKLQPLKREDQFILNRLGRLVRVADGKSLFVFDADQQTGQEQPMVMVPCSKLEYMENLTQDRGDRVKFILSGQVFTYRDVNYILPTIVREIDRRDNLNP